MAALSQPIGFIGAGQMATALGQGLVRSGVVAADRLWASDPVPEARQAFREITGGNVTANNREVVRATDVVILAVKPQQLPSVLRELQGHVSERHLVISIAAGIGLDVLAEGLGQGPRLVRVMPNTPCLVGFGACAYSLGPNATAADGALVKQLFEAVGSAWEVEEKQLDAVTGLSGSGPAFVYVMIEALSDGGVRMGLPRPVATALAAHTVRGAAEMVLATGQHPAVLKERVTSPGGTTIAGLQALESAAFRGAVMAAVEAAARRSAELGR